MEVLVLIGSLLGLAVLYGGIKGHEARRKRFAHFTSE